MFFLCKRTKKPFLVICRIRTPSLNYLESAEGGGGVDWGDGRGVPRGEGIGVPRGDGRGVPIGEDSSFFHGLMVSAPPFNIDMLYI